MTSPVFSQPVSDRRKDYIMKHTRLYFILAVILLFGLQQCSISKAQSSVPTAGTSLGAKPSPAPPALLPFIADYQKNDISFSIAEVNGKLHLVTKELSIPLREKLHGIYELPAGNPFSAVQIEFVRNTDRNAFNVKIKNTVYERSVCSLRITPLKPMSLLRKEALAAAPPREYRDFRKPELIEVNSLDPDIRLDIRYATKNNFMGAILYDEARAFLQKPAAEALVKAGSLLRKRGYGLIIFDAYRPWYITKMFWDATPDAQKIFVADPAKGSRHNRGTAVDLTIFDISTGREIDMGGFYDEFGIRAWPDYRGGTSLQRWHRALLQDIMKNYGFTVYPNEWWHFDHSSATDYPIMNIKFQDIRQ